MSALLSVSLDATGAVFPNEGVCRGLRSRNKLLHIPAEVRKPDTPDLGATMCCSDMPCLIKGEIFLMKKHLVNTCMFRELLPGVVSTLLSRFCYPKILPKRKTSLAYR